MWSDMRSAVWGFDMRLDMRLHMQLDMRSDVRGFDMWLDVRGLDTRLDVQGLDMRLDMWSDVQGLDMLALTHACMCACMHAHTLSNGSKTKHERALARKTAW